MLERDICWTSFLWQVRGCLIILVPLMFIRGDRGQNVGGGQFSRRSQISRRRYGISRRKANQPYLESAVTTRSQPLQLESVRTRASY